MSFKYLLSGLPNSGKTTLLKDLRNVFVVAVDGKKYPFEQPHTNIFEFETVEELTDIITEKINVYEDRFGELPEYVAIDSVSRILTMITNNSERKYTGFSVWTEANKEIVSFVDYINTIVDSDMGVILVAHALYDSDSKRYVEVAQGNFGKIGGFLSTVDYASFIEVTKTKREIHHRNPVKMSRTLLDDVADSELVSKFNLQDYVDKIVKKSINTEIFTL